MKARWVKCAHWEPCPVGLLPGEDEPVLTESTPQESTDGIYDGAPGGITMKAGVSKSVKGMGLDFVIGEEDVLMEEGAWLEKALDTPGFLLSFDTAACKAK